MKRVLFVIVSIKADMISDAKSRWGAKWKTHIKTDMKREAERNRNCDLVN